MDIVNSILKLLIEKNLKITTAESCTGGLIAKLITDIPGSSACFDMGFVTYSNHAKTKLLGVKPETLDKVGAVSLETAEEMCQGAMQAASADIAISVTGIAGPTGGTEQKPVGVVLIGICGRDGAIVNQCNFSGTRDEIRNQTAEFALNLAEIYIKENY